MVTAYSKLGFYGGVGDGFDRNAFAGEKFDGLIEGCFIGGFQLEHDFADLCGDFGAADIEDHVDRLGHLVNDRFLDQVGRIN